VPHVGLIVAVGSHSIQPVVSVLRTSMDACISFSFARFVCSNKLHTQSTQVPSVAELPLLTCRFPLLNNCEWSVVLLVGRAS
jgi:hypothetical protein